MLLRCGAGVTSAGLPLEEPSVRAANAGCERDESDRPVAADTEAPCVETCWLATVDWGTVFDRLLFMLD